MKTFIAFLFFQTYFFCASAQHQQYDDLVHKADALYAKKKYKNAALTYSAAFRSNNWKATSNEHYNAACSWALAGFPDSAFFHLYIVASVFSDTTYTWLKNDADLVLLHNDKRWQPLLDMEITNKQKAEAILNRPLMHLLDSINNEDQNARALLKLEVAISGWNSPKTTAISTLMELTDSTNLIEVKKIIDQYGWLGADVVGESGSLTLFLVIQHADVKTQEHYLPILRDAVKNGKAQAGNLALMEDRVAISNEKKQLYGSQVGQNKETQAYFLLPLEDPDNVDKRRTEMGLQPLADYLKNWNITWNVEQYKKENKN